MHAARNRSPEGFLKRLEARTGILVEAGHTRYLGMMVPVFEFRPAPHFSGIPSCPSAGGWPLPWP